MEPTSFYWFFQPEDFDEEGILRLDISTGRLRHKWFPTNKATALRFLRNHPDAAGLRAANRSYLLTKIIMMVEDVTDKYPKVIPEAIGKGSIVLKTPLEAALPKKSNFEEHEEYYQMGRTDLVYHTNSELSGLQMGLLSDAEIEQLAVMEVTVAESRREDGTTVPFGVSDLRMGSSAKDAEGNWEECSTCHLSSDAQSDNIQLGLCQGHFGYIDLPIPVPNVLYMGNEKEGSKNFGNPDFR